MRALAVVLLGGLLLGGCGHDPEPAAGGPTPTEWRPELWGDVSVQVPADWEYGGGPFAWNGETLACGVDGRVPYVGRPISLSDACVLYPFIGPHADPPQHPSVWLGAPLEPGSDEIGDGWVRETVEVASTTVTVTSDDPGLRAHVLGSITSQDTCPSALVGPPAPATSGGTEGSAGLRPETLTVCAYREHDDGIILTWGETLGRPAARALLAAVEDGRPARDGCDTGEPFEWVVLRVDGRSGYGEEWDTRELVASFAGGCPRIDDVALTRTLVRPWATPGVKATVSGPSLGERWVYRYFIGAQG